VSDVRVVLDHDERLFVDHDDIVASRHNGERYPTCTVAAHIVGASALARAHGERLPDMSQIAVIAKIPAAPGKRDELVAALQTALQRAESDPGTLTYILHADAKDAALVWFYELYADQDAAAAHSTSDAFKALGPAIGPFVGGRPELIYLQPLGGKGL